MTQNFQEILLDLDGDTARITLNRPSALNAITPLMLTELEAALSEVSKQDAIRFVVLTGEGRAFSAGVDLKALGERELVNGKVGDFIDIPARKVIESIEKLPQPVIARVNGFCFTGALEIVLACDLVVVSEKARLGDTHAKWGLRPTWGMSQRLVRRVGVAKARELSLTARTLTGQDAVDLGIANQVASADDLDTTIEKLIDEMRPNSSEAFIAYKDLYRAADNLGLHDGLNYEAETDYEFTDSHERLAEFR
ncbi:MAG: enoyl-CoA hydratase/isomerase family protein [Pseudomonadota bacterium]